MKKESFRNVKKWVGMFGALCILFFGSIVTLGGCKIPELSEDG